MVGRGRQKYRMLEGCKRRRGGPEVAERWSRGGASEWGRRHSEPSARTLLCAPMWRCVRPATCPQERFFGGCTSGGSRGGRLVRLGRVGGWRRYAGRRSRGGDDGSGRRKYRMLDIQALQLLCSRKASKGCKRRRGGPEVAERWSRGGASEWARRHSEPSARTLLCAPMCLYVRPATCPQERVSGGVLRGVPWWCVLVGGGSGRW